METHAVVRQRTSQDWETCAATVISVQGQPAAAPLRITMVYRLAAMAIWVALATAAVVLPPTTLSPKSAATATSGRATLAAVRLGTT